MFMVNIFVTGLAEGNGTKAKNQICHYSCENYIFCSTSEKLDAINLHSYYSTLKQKYSLISKIKNHIAIQNFILQLFSIRGQIKN